MTSVELDRTSGESSLPADIAEIRSCAGRQTRRATPPGQLASAQSDSWGCHDRRHRADRTLRASHSAARGTGHRLHRTVASTEPRASLRNGQPRTRYLFSGPLRRPYRPTSRPGQRAPAIPGWRDARLPGWLLRRTQRQHLDAHGRRHSGFSLLDPDHRHRCRTRDRPDECLYRRGAGRMGNLCAPCPWRDPRGQEPRIHRGCALTRGQRRPSHHAGTSCRT